MHMVGYELIDRPIPKSAKFPYFPNIKAITVL